MIGYKFISADGFDCEVIGKKSLYALYRCDKNGCMKSDPIPFVKSGTASLLFYGFGYIEAESIKEYSEIKKSDSWKLYSCILHRCFSGYNDNYSNVHVSDEWRSYENFRKWYNKNYIPGFVIDKDLFSPPDKKAYSPETCCFIPAPINNMIKANPGNILFNGYKYFYMNDSVPSKPKSVSFKNKEEAVESKREYLKIRIQTVAWIFRDKLKPEVYEKLISLYEK